MEKAKKIDFFAYMVIIEITGQPVEIKKIKAEKEKSMHLELSRERGGWWKPLIAEDSRKPFPSCAAQRSRSFQYAAS